MCKSHEFRNRDTSSSSACSTSCLTGNDKYLDSRYRKAQAYEALDHLLTTALNKGET